MTKTEREILRALADGALLLHATDRATPATLTTGKRTTLVAYGVIDSLVERGLIEECGDVSEFTTYRAPNSQPLATFERAPKSPRGSIGKCVSCRRSFYAAAQSDARCCRECAGEDEPRFAMVAPVAEVVESRRTGAYMVGRARRRGRGPRED